MLTLPLGISPRKLLPQGSGSTQRVKTRGFDYIPQRAGKSSQTSFLERKLGKELFPRAQGGSLTLALIEPVTHARGTMPPEERYPKELGKELFLRAQGGSLALALIEPITHARGTIHARARDYAAGRAYPKELGKELFLRARGGSLTLALIEPVTHARGTMPPEGRTQKSWAKNFFFAPGAAR